MRRAIQVFGLLFMMIAIFLYVPGIAQEPNGDQVIRLKSGALYPAANAVKWTDSMAHFPAPKEPVQVLIHFSHLPTQDERAALKQKGITLYDYIPDNTFSALIQFPMAANAVLSAPVHSILTAKPEWKADNYLWKKVSTETETIELLVSFYKTISATDVKKFITSVGAQSTPSPMEQYGYYKITVAAAKVHAIAEWYGVRYISPGGSMIPLDQQSLPAVSGNLSASSPAYGGYSLMGDSVTVGVGDNGAGIYHVDVKDRITNFNPAPLSNHGEFVNAIVAGAAIADPLAKSMAPHALLVDHLYDLMLSATGAMFHDYNMTITNNSYELLAANCDYTGVYDAYSEFLDTLSMQYPEVQHVFASGNDGGMTCSPYPAGFATIEGGYQPAKNTIVVGSMTDYLIQAGDESRGPMKDGRLKPDIIAIGLGAYSAVNVDQYEWSAGTSFASPQVAGGLAILTQRYKQLHGGAQPRADLLKAILLNGAQDLGNPGPDFSYGFGGMDIYHSLRIIDSNRFASNTIASGDSQTINITVPSNGGILKVMLYWNDVPASPSAAKQLVNDLDLSVTGPDLSTHLPLVLDATPANVNNNATEQADHINNAEQVTIAAPAAGTYTIKVKGYSIPSGTQAYVIAYDIIPQGIHLTFPTGAEQLPNEDSIRVFWDAITDSNAFTVQRSTDNGTTWTVLSNSVPPDIRHYDFIPVDINSGNCIMRVSKNNTAQVATSARFVINVRPVALPDSVQCPGYVNIHWSPIPGAASYYLLQKKGFDMQVTDSVTDTTYSFSDMSLNEKSYVAVQPVLNGLPGYRSVAVIRQANTGNCTNPVSTGDLMIEKIIAPHSGRMFTSTQLGASTTMQVQLRDLYSAGASSYTLSYTINGGPWQTLVNPGTIPADNIAIISVPGLDLSAQGTYSIAVAVHNTGITDPQHRNDTLSFTVLNLPNDTLNLSIPFFDGFETMSAFAVSVDSIGVSPNAHWDYYNANDSGRMRSFVNDDITITGSRSISLDENQATVNGSKNTFIGTFNLLNYDTATTEIRVDFDYVLHGTPKAAAGNIVTARGADTAAFSPFFTYDLNAYPGTLNHVQSLSLTDAVRLSGHNFSTSSQVSFGQSDTSLIAAPSYGNGITLDNFKMYTVANDADLVSIVSPLPTNCGLPSTTPLTIQVHNGVNYTLHNVLVFYSMDSGTVYTGTIDSISAKNTTTFTFAQQLNVTAGSTHTLDVWLRETGDTYNANDSIMHYAFRNSEIISAYPYLENFEAGDGGYYSEGLNGLWQYGTPASPKINRAASGTKAWKTNLTGNYNNLETSYLYSPCFDLSSVAMPMLSFSTAMDIENCGTTLCDASYIEFSFDGIDWQKLGAEGQGSNWYDTPFDVWNTEGFTRWHVASFTLPQPPAGGSIRFRFVLKSDPGATFEGVAIDDIHIFDRLYAILPEKGATIVSHDLSSNTWTDYLQTSQLLTSIQPGNQTIDNTTVTLFAQDTLTNPGATQFTMPRSYTIETTAIPVDSSTIRLYLLDSDVVNVLNATVCPSCSRFSDAYRLGITQYDNSSAPNLENKTLSDNVGGIYTYYPYTSVKWVPYDQGYYAEIKAKPFSEFWFNDGGPTSTFPVGIDYLNFIAFRSGDSVTSYWYSLIDTAVNIYTPQWSLDAVNFGSVKDTPALHTNPAQYAVNDPINFNKYPVLYYRLKWTMLDKDSIYYSPVRRVDYSDSLETLIDLEAQMVSEQNVQVNWTSGIDGIVSFYILDRAIGNANYATVDNVTSQRHYGEQYTYIDAPKLATPIPPGTPIHYKITAVLRDSTTVQSAVRTIAWQGPNTFASIYPNPTHNGLFTIQWLADPGTEMQLTITDATGRTLYKTSAVAAQWNNITTIQTDNFAQGIYFVTMTIGGVRHTMHIVYE